MYILPFTDILYAAYVWKKWLPDDSYDGQPKHVAVKKELVYSGGNNKKSLCLYPISTPDGVMTQKTTYEITLSIRCSYT
jgi:hypothetical protein